MCKILVFCYYESLIASRVIALCQAFSIAVFLQVHPLPVSYNSLYSHRDHRRAHRLSEPSASFAVLVNRPFCSPCFLRPYPHPCRVYSFFRAICSCSYLRRTPTLRFAKSHRSLAQAAPPHKSSPAHSLLPGEAPSLLRKIVSSLKTHHHYTSIPPSQIPPFPHKFALSIANPAPSSSSRKAILAHVVPTFQPQKRPLSSHEVA